MQMQMDMSMGAGRQGVNVPGELSLDRGGAITNGGTDAQGDQNWRLPYYLTYTIENTGGSALLISTPTLGTPTNMSVTLDEAPAASLQPEDTTTFVLLVTPTAAGAFSVAVTIPTNVGNFVFTVSGTGTDASVVATLRAINSGGTATKNIVCDGLMLGTATAGYTSMAAAHTAASNGDELIATEAIVDGAAALTKTGLLIDVMDGCRNDKTQVDNGYRMTSAGAAATLAVDGTGCIVRNLAINYTGGTHSTAQSVPSTATVTWISCLFAYNGTVNGACFAYAGSGTLNFYNCIAWKATGTSSWSLWHDFSAGTVTTNFVNCSGWGAAAITNLKGILSVGTANVTNCIMIVPGTAYTNCTAGAAGVGYNAGSDTTAPGTTAWDNLTAGDVFESVGAGTEDLHWPDRATMLAYAGADVVATTTIDVDGQTRAAHYIGADYVPA